MIFNFVRHFVQWRTLHMYYYKGWRTRVTPNTFDCGWHATLHMLDYKGWRTRITPNTFDYEWHPTLKNILCAKKRYTCITIMDERQELHQIPLTMNDTQLWSISYALEIHYTCMTIGDKGQNFTLSSWTSMIILMNKREKRFWVIPN